jgi:hypothetical protein
MVIGEYFTFLILLGVLFKGCTVIFEFSMDMVRGTFWVRWRRLLQHFPHFDVGIRVSWESEGNCGELRSTIKSARIAS